MKKVLKYTIVYSKIILAFVFFATIFFGYYSTKLQIDASSETLLLENDKDLSIWRNISKRYVSPNFLVVTYTPKDSILSEKSINLISNLSSEFEKNELVTSVVSIINVPLLKSVKGGIGGILDHTPTLIDKDIDKKLVEDEFKNSPIYSQNLISKDLKTTAIVLNLKADVKFNKLLSERNLLLALESNSTITNEQKQKLLKVKNEFKEYRDELRIKEHQNLEQIKSTISKFNNQDNVLFLGGANMIADDMVSFVKDDIFIYGISVTVLLCISLWLFFRQIIWVVLPISICILSVVFSMGVFGFFGWEITVVSSNFVSLVLIISISIIIHLIVSYREFYIKHPKFTQKQLVYITMRDKASPSFWAILTTIIGFTSLMSADIKPVVMLGLMMSAGISISLLLAFLVFSSIVSNINKIPPKETFENKFHITEYCANFAIKDKKIIYIVCSILLCFGVFGISKVKVENSFIGYFKENTEIRQSMQVIDENLGGTIPLDIIVKFKEEKKDTQDEFDEFESEFNKDANDAKYWFNSYHTRIAEKIHDHLTKQRFVGSVSSLGTLIKVIKELNNGEVDDFLLAAMYEKLPLEYKNILLTPYVNVKDNELRFSLRIIDSDKNLRRDEFLKNLKSSLDELTKDDNVKVSIAGLMVLYNNVLLNLVTSQIDTLSISLFVLFVLFCFIFRNLKIASLAIIANVLPLCVLFGIIGVFGIPLDVMSITIAAISIGIGVDDIIHYTHRFLHEKKTKNTVDSIKQAHSSIGYAMYYTSFTIILGFSVMITSNFIPTIYFGLLTVLVMGLMLISALVLYPKMIMSFYKR
ncbi:RND superfamily exporter [Campylobacter pinnipediorum subsp. pinnipediorum]|uniref:efflux RND transporter permease subunit n=1 Tax=Campylobacter pinnipediorum TaxID=1965231 RepID=UPI00099516B8|nr:MMPL family transporter [Campylobacter pinnipediorum]AQW81317.1 RND superfamily exporter [Campylobacter pinnipediorum subsp. pinnipediorum]